jgi:hypothetical protein
LHPSPQSFSSSHRPQHWSAGTHSPSPSSPSRAQHFSFSRQHVGPQHLSSGQQT